MLLTSPSLAALPRVMEDWTHAEVMQFLSVAMPQFCGPAVRHRFRGVDLVALDLRTAARMPFNGYDETLALRLLHLVNLWHEKVRREWAQD